MEMDERSRLEMKIVLYERSAKNKKNAYAFLVLSAVFCVISIFFPSDYMSWLIVGVMMFFAGIFVTCVLSIRETKLPTLRRQLRELEARQGVPALDRAQANRNASGTEAYGPQSNEGTSSTAFCKYCGSRIDGDSMFCNKCGKKLVH